MWAPDSTHRNYYGMDIFEFAVVSKRDSRGSEDFAGSDWKGGTKSSFH